MGYVKKGVKILGYALIIPCIVVAALGQYAYVLLEWLYYIVRFINFFR